MCYWHLHKEGAQWQVKSIFLASLGFCISDRTSLATFRMQEMTQGRKANITKIMGHNIGWRRGSAWKLLCLASAGKLVFWLLLKEWMVSCLQHGPSAQREPAPHGEDVFTKPGCSRLCACISTHRSLSAGLCASTLALGPVSSLCCSQVEGIFPNCSWEHITLFLRLLPIALWVKSQLLNMAPKKPGMSWLLLTSPAPSPSHSLFSTHTWRFEVFTKGSKTSHTVFLLSSHISPSWPPKFSWQIVSSGRPSQILRTC